MRGHQESAGGPRGEWLFKKRGQVFGPVPVKVLLEMLYRGEVSGETPVAAEDGAYQPLGRIPAFLVHVKKAEAALRVEREVTGARMLRRRRSVVRSTVVAILGLAVLLGGSWLAHWLATTKPWQKRSALLEDFGNGIGVVAEARVGTGHRFEDDEVDVPALPDRPRPALHGHGTSRAPAGGTLSDGDLVETRFDEGEIRNALRRQQRTLEPCLIAEWRRSPGFSGVIPLVFAIGNDGRVAKLDVDEPRFKHGELRDCLFRTMQGWRFKPFPGQRPNVSLDLSIGGGR